MARDRFVLLEIESGRPVPNPSGSDVLQTGDLEEIEEYLALKTGRHAGLDLDLASDGGQDNG